MRRALAAAALATLALAASSAPRASAGPENGFEGAAKSFRRALDDADADARLRAFQRMGEVRDPRAVGLLAEGLDKERSRRDALGKQQAEAEAALEAVLTEIEKANATVPSTPRAVEAYNARMRKAEARREEHYARLRDLAAEQAQARAILGAGVAAIGRVVDSLDADPAQAAVDALAASWTGPKSAPEERVWLVDVLSSVTKVPTGPRLRQTLQDETGDLRARTAALSARVARRDEGTIEDCVSLLSAAPSPLTAEAIEGLRRLHLPGGIEPLIEFLGRSDIGRLREDAQRTLRSLTGQKHGPFQQPWRDWWAEAKRSFEMPPKPADYGELLRADKAAVTFYGVTTFSDKILFVLDVSGSMLDLANPDAAGTRGEQRKIDVARRELASALDMLDASKRFNVLFFNHRLVKYEAGMVQAAKGATERARRFAMELEPVGGTNIHDAIETAFRLANASADGKDYEPVIDTIFFMTDGTPTAGKLQKPDQILEAVREWNRTAKITIHSIAVGKSCDAKFLEALSSQNGGDYVHR